jgi:hypothetical protein
VTATNQFTWSTASALRLTTLTNVGRGRPGKPLLPACFLPRSPSPQEALLRCLEHGERNRLTLPFAQTSRAPSFSCKHVVYRWRHLRRLPTPPTAPITCTPSPTPSRGTTSSRGTLLFRWLLCFCASGSDRSTHHHPVGNWSDFQWSVLGPEQRK